MHLLFLIMSLALSAGGSEPGDSEWDSGTHEYIVARYFQKRQFIRTSNLGAILFKNEMLNLTPKRKRFLVYIHKTRGVSLRFKNSQQTVSTGNSQGILEGCSVSNCDFMDDPEWLMEADAVLVILGLKGTSHPTLPSARASHQRWVFLATGSPPYTLDSNKIGDLANMFNWSMTYRTESDVPIPFGRTVPLATPVDGDSSLSSLVPYWREKQRHVLAAALLSNCRAQPRFSYLNTLKLYMRVHYYGSCFYRKPNEQCPQRGECKSLNRYLFYLAFENAECAEYMTERVFEHALLRGAIPVVLGASYSECATLLPPGSFLHVRNYSTHRDLAKHMQAIVSDETKLLTFHKWRRHFEVRSETQWTGAHGSRLCRLCEALNYNGRSRRRYEEDDLRRVLDRNANCRNVA